MRKDEQAALAKAVQLRVILGRSQEEIATELRLTIPEVKRKLKEARKDGGARDAAELLVLQRLLPKAVAVFDSALNGEEIPKGSIEVAKDVLFGSGTLKKKDEVNVTHDVSPLEAYRREREIRLAEVHEAEPDPPALMLTQPDDSYEVDTPLPEGDKAPVVEMDKVRLTGDKHEQKLRRI